MQHKVRVHTRPEKDYIVNPLHEQLLIKKRKLPYSGIILQIDNALRLRFALIFL